MPSDHLLKLLDQEDIYVDVNTLIKNFKYQWSVIS